MMSYVHNGFEEVKTLLLVVKRHFADGHSLYSHDFSTYFSSSISNCAFLLHGQAINVLFHHLRHILCFVTRYTSQSFHCVMPYIYPEQLISTIPLAQCYSKFLYSSFLLIFAIST